MRTETYDVVELKLISVKLQNRIEAINRFNNEEATFGEFMQKKQEHTQDLISLESVAKFVLIDGMAALKGLILMQQHLVNWKFAIDLKISEIVSAEFPREGTTIL